MAKPWNTSQKEAAMKAIEITIIATVNLVDSSAIEDIRSLDP